VHVHYSSQSLHSDTLVNIVACLNMHAIIGEQYKNETEVTLLYIAVVNLCTMLCKSSHEKINKNTYVLFRSDNPVVFN